MQLRPKTDEEIALFEKEREEGGKAAILDRIKDVKAGYAFPDLLRQHFDFLYNGDGVLLNSEFVIEFVSGSEIATIRRITSLTSYRSTVRGIRMLIHAADTAGLTLRISDEYNNFHGCRSELISMDGFRAETDHGDKYLTRRPRKLLYSLKLTADIALREMDYSFLDVEQVTQDYRLKDDIEVKSLRNDEHYITLEAKFFYTSQEDEVKAFLMERMKVFLHNRRYAAHGIHEALDHMLKEAQKEDSTCL